MNNMSIIDRMRRNADEKNGYGYSYEYEEEQDYEIEEPEQEEATYKAKGRIPTKIRTTAVSGLRKVAQSKAPERFATRVVRQQVGYSRPRPSGSTTKLKKSSKYYDDYPQRRSGNVIASRLSGASEFGERLLNIKGQSKIFGGSQQKPISYIPKSSTIARRKNKSGIWDIR